SSPSRLAARLRDVPEKFLAPRPAMNLRAVLTETFRGEANHEATISFGPGCSAGGVWSVGSRLRQRRRPRRYLQHLGGQCRSRTSFRRKGQFHSYGGDAGLYVEGEREQSRAHL